MVVLAAIVAWISVYRPPGVASVPAIADLLPYRVEFSSRSVVPSVMWANAPQSATLRVAVDRRTTMLVPTSSPSITPPQPLPLDAELPTNSVVSIATLAPPAMNSAPPELAATLSASCAASIASAPWVTCATGPSTGPSSATVSLRTPTVCRVASTRKPKPGCGVVPRTLVTAAPWPAITTSLVSAGSAWPSRYGRASSSTSCLVPRWFAVSIAARSVQPPTAEARQVASTPASSSAASRSTSTT